MKTVFLDTNVVVDLLQKRDQIVSDLSLVGRIF